MIFCAMPSITGYCAGADCWAAASAPARNRVETTTRVTIRRLMGSPSLRLRPTLTIGESSAGQGLMAAVLGDHPDLLLRRVERGLRGVARPVGQRGELH